MDPRLSALYQRRSGHQDRFDAEPLMLFIDRVMDIR